MYISQMRDMQCCLVSKSFEIDIAIVGMDIEVFIHLISVINFIKNFIFSMCMCHLNALHLKFSILDEESGKCLLNSYFWNGKYVPLPPPCWKEYIFIFVQSTQLFMVFMKDSETESIAVDTLYRITGVQIPYRKAFSISNFLHNFLFRFESAYEMFVQFKNLSKQLTFQCFQWELKFI